MVGTGKRCSRMHEICDVASIPALLYSADSFKYSVSSPAVKADSM